MGLRKSVEVLVGKRVLGFGEKREKMKGLK